jgi:adenylate cyclase
MRSEVVKLFSPGTDERATIAELDANRALFRLHTEEHGGRIVDKAGDSVLAVFAPAAGAVRAAVAAQAAVEEPGAGVPDDRRMRYRVGINLGDIIEKADGSIYGDGVNVAARARRGRSSCSCCRLDCDAGSFARQAR